MNTKALVILGVVAIAGASAFAYFKRPKVVININDETGEGTASLGGKRLSFNKTTGGVVSTWNGYQLSVGNGFTFSQNGKVLESTNGITPYDGGSSYVIINHVK